MQWTVHGERSVYESEWMNLSLVDVELPSGKRFEHHVLRMPCDAAGVVVDDPERGVLLLWRHRFISDTWGWEVPAGRVDPGETPEQCAARETLEETGWRAGELTKLTSYRPHNGTSDAHFHLYAASSADLRRRADGSRRGRAHRVGAVAALARGDPRRPHQRRPVAHRTALVRRVLVNFVAHAGSKKFTRSDQNSSSKATSPATPVWYELTVRSKKFDRPCTSCSSMKLNGFFEPNSIP